MKVYLIRHGETTGDIEHRFGGYYDDNLTEKGKLQAEELAKKLKNKKIEIIFTSPKLKAKQTTKEVNNLLNIPVKIIEDLKERNTYGVLTGLTKEEAQNRYPKEYKKNLKSKIHHNVTNSESYKDNIIRVKKVFEHIFSQNYKTIAIISHGGIITNYIKEILTNGKNLKIGDCGILEIEKNKEQFNINCLYNTDLSD